MKLTKISELEIEDFGDFRLITRPTGTFILHKKDMPRDLNDLWDYNSWQKMLWFLSEEYLAAYYEGNWSASDDKTIASREALKEGRVPYRNGINEGLWYHIDGQPVVRKVLCEFWSTYYPDVKGLKDVLEKHGQWHDIEVKQQKLGLNVSITGHHFLVAKYLPTQEEMTSWGKRKGVTYLMQNIGNSYGHLHDADYIKMFKVFNV